MEAATALTHRQGRSSAAPARRAPRTAPARPATRPRPATRQRPAARPRTRTQDAAKRPVRIARPVTAIGEVADSRLIVRLTRSQAWIAIIGALLIGIVALNVYSLGMGSAVSATAQQAADLERQNSLLREQIGKVRKNGELERFAAKLGLGQPTSEQLTEITARSNDVKLAAQRLKDLAAGTAPVAVSAVPETAVAAPVEAAPVATAPLEDPALVDPAAAAPPETTPVAPVETAPAETAPAPDATAATAGGITP